MAAEQQIEEEEKNAEDKDKKVVDLDSSVMILEPRGIGGPRGERNEADDKVVAIINSGNDELE